MIELGQTIGNYRITAKLGEGGMGAVYRAEHPIIGRKVALKVVHPQFARNAEVVARFINEATAISRIGHEHIVEVTDLGRTPAGDLYFVMEYLEGRSLAELVAREAPLPPARALAIAAQIADALAASHAHGVIHRDLKPDNIFLVARGPDPDFVKVLDFGLAKLMNADGPATWESRAGIVMGTPYYMSPEQCRGESVIDHRADVYALGVVLFEMLTGKQPFTGEGCGEVLLKQVSMRPPLARSLVPELPAALEAVLQRALAKRPDERFATMGELRARLLAAPDPLPRAHLSDVLFARARRHADPPARVHTTLGQGAAAVEDDAALDRVPRHRGGRVLALVGAAALGATMLSAALPRVGARHASAMPTTAAPAAPPSQMMVVSFTASHDAGVAADGGVAAPSPTLESGWQEIR
jgi:serine/threonine-protein kinase